MGNSVAIPSQPPPSPVRTWWVACRPWALPASTMPVLFGTVLATTLGGAAWQPLRFALALLGMVLLHTAANLRSDVSDFRRGLDTEVSPVSGALVRGWVRPHALLRASWLLFAIGGVLGAGLAWVTGPALWWIGGVGVAIGVGYSTLKYRALGDGAVFLNFGLLGAAGAWVVQTRTFSFTPIIAAVPIALLVVGILHANNWRDMKTDAARNIRTSAGALGDRGSEIYFGILLGLPFIWVAALMIVPRVLHTGLPPFPPSFLLVALAVPRAGKLWRRARRRHAPETPMDFQILDGAMAKLNLEFGLLCVAALLVDAVGTWYAG